MPVYETRRTACYPQEVYAEVKAMATKLELQGFAISGGRSAVPFPIPKSGLEVMWNHQQRYLGGGVSRDYHSFPVRASGDFYKIGAHEYRIFNQNLDQPQDNLLLAFLSYFTAPATLEGTVFLVHGPLDQVKQARSAWIYNAGQRRVRRAPDLAYDNVNDGTEGIRVTDQFDGWSGAPDRYDWKLVGKKEVYVPYNAFRQYDLTQDWHKIYFPDHVSETTRRYELHRVWVVEATVKAGTRHSAARRTFYLDEDTWAMLILDSYDAQGKLWKTAEDLMIPAWENNSACVYSGVFYYNLVSRRLEIDQFSINGTHGGDFKFLPDTVGHPEFSTNFYTPENLRAISER